MAESASLKVGRLEYVAVEVDAVAGEISRDVLRRAAEAAILTIRWLDEADNGLNETQQIELVSTVMRMFDGVEHEITSALARDASTTSRVRLVEEVEES
jgi:hypothetical protein